jgi:hypothetical protein
MMLLEEELENSVALEQETDELRIELQQAREDRKSALLAARQLSDFMEKQKSTTGFRGDEMTKDRMAYFQKRLEEKWVNFVALILATFKEQMRLLGGYFEMVVRVVESPDILTMIAASTNDGGGWFWQSKSGKTISRRERTSPTAAHGAYQVFQRPIAGGGK